MTAGHGYFMKVSFLCNSFLALPSARFILDEHCLAGLATSANNKILEKQMAHLAASCNVPFASISKNRIENDLRQWIEQTNPDVVLVQTFPYLIPASCLNLPRLGFYNLHPSPLPAYRGPDPIFWQILNDEQSSGVTLHKMEAAFDTGPLFSIEPCPIESSDTYGLVQSNLSFAAVEAIKAFLSCDDLENELEHQCESSSSSQSRPGPNDLIIDWMSAPAAKIKALTRACNPHQNGAITFFRDVMTRILETEIRTIDRIPKLAPGTVIAADDTRGLHVLCADNQALEICILHVEEGYYTGSRFCEVFKVRIGEKFCNPAFLS